MDSNDQRSRIVVSQQVKSRGKVYLDWPLASCKDRSIHKVKRNNKGKALEKKSIKYVG